jgi:hypothetical protein
VTLRGAGERGVSVLLSEVRLSTVSARGGVGVAECVLAKLLTVGALCEHVEL